MIAEEGFNMILKIDTTKDIAILQLIEKNSLVDEISWDSKANQTEKVLYYIDKLARRNRCSRKDLKKITVNNFDGSYTALRIGVTVANFLSFALNIPVESFDKTSRESFFTEAVLPKYSREPKITKSHRQ